MRTTIGSRRVIRSLLVANGCVALVTSGGALVVLLIAPLGLAAVLTCTLLVALLSFCAGLLADVVLWRLLLAHDQTGEADQHTAFEPGRSRSRSRRLYGSEIQRLPERRS